MCFPNSCSKISIKQYSRGDILPIIPHFLYAHVTWLSSTGRADTATDTTTGGLIKAEKVEKQDLDAGDSKTPTQEKGSNNSASSGQVAKRQRSVLEHEFRSILNVSFTTIFTFKPGYVNIIVGRKPGNPGKTTFYWPFKDKCES